MKSNCKTVITSVLILSMAAIMFTGCASSVLPVESQAESSSVAVDTNGNELNGEQLYEAKIEESKMRQLTDYVMTLAPIPTNEEIAQRAAEHQQSQPYLEADADLINFCSSESGNAMADFMKDYPSDSYVSNESNRILKKIYDGQNDKEVNGGVDLQTIGFETGYWRVTDCSYYNLVFLNNAAHNSVRVLYRCKMFHYVLNEQENLADSMDKTELTADNSTVNEYDNAFLVVTLTDICPKDIQNASEGNSKISSEILMFTDYNSALTSFTAPKHTFKDLYLSEDYKGSVVNGYVGEPLVVMPDLVGKYIDVSMPKKVKELDALGITNYSVEWAENDGSSVPYSILSTSVAAGSVVDITDTNEDSTITVTVADKVSEEAQSNSDAEAEDSSTPVSSTT